MSDHFKFGYQNIFKLKLKNIKSESSHKAIKYKKIDIYYMFIYKHIGDR